MLHLNLPKCTLKVSRDSADRLKVFDTLRKKYVALTPEEYVRQHFVNYLINDLHYPVGLTANEVTIKLNDTTKRCDTVVWDKTGRPVMIVEYKAPAIAITQEVFDQIVRYNMVLHADYIVVSNGLQHFCCRLDYTNNTYQFIPQIPDYNALIIGASEN
ncbi:MAG: type I restriction enzyme HsdR N-terminal domain-containing protein [Muribaculaceae bacterium]|nr:type I restriction enzyme HsdR N-terminal domain-containing protein [Muribaculaceae bacterium]MBO7164866.1 type I restriction enzyme HsdR N-terminal domain-containing protein [Muribaculaceae bacterium]